MFCSFVIIIILRKELKIFWILSATLPPPGTLRTLHFVLCTAVTIVTPPFVLTQGRNGFNRPVMTTSIVCTDPNDKDQCSKCKQDRYHHRRSAVGGLSLQAFSGDFLPRFLPPNIPTSESISSDFLGCHPGGEIAVSSAPAASRPGPSAERGVPKTGSRNCAGGRLCRIAVLTAAVGFVGLFSVSVGIVLGILVASRERSDTVGMTGNVNCLSK